MNLRRIVGFTYISPPDMLPFYMHFSSHCNPKSSMHITGHKTAADADMIYKPANALATAFKLRDDA